MSKKNKILLCVFIGIILLIFFVKINNSDYNLEKELGIHDRPFNEYVVFYPQHQDDEVLWGGSALRRAINTKGANHVFVVLVSDGSGVNVFKNKQYKNTSRKEKEQLIKEGKILNWGISEANEEYLRRAHNVCPVTAVENRYSMMARQYESLFSVLEELNVGLIAFSPMANGILTGKYDNNSTFDKKLDYRSNMPQFKPEAYDKNQNLIKLLEETASKHDATPAQISMAWMLCKKPWIVPIPGTRKVERIF